MYLPSQTSMYIISIICHKNMPFCLYKKTNLYKLSWFEISLRCLNKKTWASVILTALKLTQTDCVMLQRPKPDGAQPQTLSSYCTKIEQIHFKQVKGRKQWIWFYKTAWNVMVKQMFTVELKKGRRAAGFCIGSAQVWVWVRLWVWGGKILSSRSFPSPPLSCRHRWQT